MFPESGPNDEFLFVEDGDERIHLRRAHRGDQRRHKPDHANPAALPKRRGGSLCLTIVSASRGEFFTCEPFAAARRVEGAAAKARFNWKRAQNSERQEMNPID